MLSLSLGRFLEIISDSSVSLDPSRIRGQDYDGASVKPSGIAGIQAKIKEISLLAWHTHNLESRK